jgi:hypothetical protein
MFLRRMSRSMQSYTVLAGVGLITGASMEFFMIKTGFYDIATRKAAERKAEADYENEEYWNERSKRDTKIR